MPVSPKYLLLEIIEKFPTLAGVTVALVAREAVALVAPDIVGTVCEHITGSEISNMINTYQSNPTI